VGDDERRGTGHLNEDVEMRRELGPTDSSERSEKLAIQEGQRVTSGDYVFVVERIDVGLTGAVRLRFEKGRG
jgi:hypothetical protein